MKKTIALLTALAITFHSTIAVAEDTPEPVPDLRVTTLNQGQKAPFSGLLLTPDSLSKIESQNKQKLLLLENDYKFKLSRCELKLDSEVALRISEQKMHEEIFNSQLRRIETLEQIAMEKKPDWVLPVAILGAFVVGVGATVGITYAVNQ